MKKREDIARRISEIEATMLQEFIPERHEFLKGALEWLVWAVDGDRSLAAVKPLPEPRCSNCACGMFAEYTDKDTKDRVQLKEGTCRRYPPKVMVYDERTSTEWPAVYLGGWCGEYRRGE